MSEGSPSRFALFWEKNGWLGLIIIAASIVFFAVSAILAAASAREFSSAIETEGTIYNLAYQPMSVARAGQPARREAWVVSVDYIVDGEPYFNSRAIPEEHWEQLAVGDVIPVQYMPDDPDTIWVLSHVDDSWSSGLRFSGFVALFIGLFLVWAPWVVAGNELKKHLDGGR